MVYMASVFVGQSIRGALMGSRRFDDDDDDATTGTWKTALY